MTTPEEIAIEHLVIDLHDVLETARAFVAAGGSVDGYSSAEQSIAAERALAVYSESMDESEATARACYEARKRAAAAARRTT